MGNLAILFNQQSGLPAQQQAARTVLILDRRKCRATIKQRNNETIEQIILDFRAEEPIMQQIVRQIERMVQDGILKQGDQLPTVRELATELRINFSTVARAYKILDEERLISTQRGRGTFIWEEPTPETTQNLRRKHLEALAKNYLSEAARLGYSGEEAARFLTDLLNTASDDAVKQSTIEKRL
jgi:GntR family transcriptional regulator